MELGAIVKAVSSQCLEVINMFRRFFWKEPEDDAAEIGCEDGDFFAGSDFGVIGHGPIVTGGRRPGAGRMRA